MMILSLDCANFSTSLALLKDNQILATFKSSSPYGESATLVSRIKELFKKSDQILAKLNAIVVTTGPGSFTGIRLGIAAARGLSYALKIPLYAVNSFSWVAHSYKKTFGLSTNLLIALESKREEIFFAIYDKDLTCIQKPIFLKPEEMIALLDFKNLQVAGDGTKHLRYKTRNGQEEMSQGWMPHASDLASYLQIHKLSPEKFDKCQPYYIRAPEIHGRC